jgi:hypothetical protein
MNNHDSGNDFLDDLYAKSAKELPPTALDQAIIKEAYAKVHKRDFVSRLQWQRFLSVAAVMVLSVYIFFDVGEYSMDAESFAPSEERIESGAPVYDDAHAPRIEEPRVKAEKSKAKKVIDPAVYESPAAMESTLAADDFSDASSDPQIMSESDDSGEISGLVKEQSSEVYSTKLEQKPEALLKKAFSRSQNKQAVSAELALPGQVSKDAENITLEPEKMLREIERLIEVDNLVEAKQMFQRLSESYPQYPIPSKIVSMFR